MVTDLIDNMEIKDFKKIARTLKSVYEEVEKEALKVGIIKLTPEWDKLIKKARQEVLNANGFTLEEYREAKDNYLSIEKEKEKLLKNTGRSFESIIEEESSKLRKIRNEADDVLEELKRTKIPSKEEIETLYNKALKEYIRDVVVEREVIVEKPKIIKEKIIQKVGYDDKKLNKKIDALAKELSNVPKLKYIKDYVMSDFGERFKENINILNMPDFRKLAMGLQAQIDEIRGSTGAGISDGDKGDITVSGSGTVWNIDAGTVGITELSATGTPSASTFLRGDNTWATPAGSGVDGSGTTNEIAYWVDSDTLGALAVATYPSLTELSYVKGVTSAIQTQLNAKAPTTSPTFATSITGSYLTASEILITDGSKNIVSAPVATYPSLTELTYVKGVTSAIQTQLNAKGTVSSVAMTVPTGLTISGSPVTTTGTLAVALDTGYVIPLQTTLDAKVVGPASSTDNAIARFDSTTGKLIQNSSVTISDVTTGTVTISSPEALTFQTENAVDTLTFQTLGAGADISFYSVDDINLEASGYGYFQGVEGFDVFTTNATGTNSAGSVNIYGGAGGGTSGAGGNVNITGGNATAGNSNGGDISLFSGAKSGSGTDGDIFLEPAGSGKIKSQSGTITPILSKSFSIENPTSSEDFGGVYFDDASTITKIVAVLVGSSTPSVTWTVRHHTDRSNAGNEVVTGGTTTTSTTTGSVVTSFNDATVPADSFVWLETTAKSGTVNSIHITIFYRIDA